MDNSLKISNNSLSSNYILDNLMKSLKSISQSQLSLEEKRTDEKNKEKPYSEDIVMNEGVNSNKSNEIIEIMKGDLKNISKENSELKFCIKSLNNKFENDNKKLKEQLIQKNKALMQTSELIKLLEVKLKEYEENLKVLNTQEDTKKLKEELITKDKIIESLKKEINTKEEIFNEVGSMKDEMEQYLKTMEVLYNELNKKDEIINNLKEQININTNQIKEVKELSNNNNKDDDKNELILKLKETQALYEEEKQNNEKLQNLTKEASEMIKTALNSRDSLKKEYEKAIQELTEKFEKQIEYMKLLLIKQAKENELKNAKENNNNLTDNKDTNTNLSDNKDMVKLIEDNKLLLEKNEELRKMNELLLAKMKSLPDLEKKFTELFETVSLLKEENDLLKKAALYKIALKDLGKEDNIENENENNENNIEQDIKLNTIPSLENKKNQLLDESNGSKSDDSVKLNTINNNKVYNKKLPKKSNNIKTPSNKEDEIKTPEENQQQQNLGEEENTEDINPSFNLYKPYEEGLLLFNLAKKNYFTVNPENYEEFWENYEPEGSIQYNTLEGLFIINAKNKTLYYFSSKKNTICKLFSFNENHKYGCLFLDNFSKNIIAIGGKETKLVEKFSFDSPDLELLPSLKYCRYNTSCCQVNNKIYLFFGICNEKPNLNIIEFLNMDDTTNGWVDINFINNTSFNLINKISVVNLNDSELLIIGGQLHDKNEKDITKFKSNDKLVFFNIQTNELIELDKELPDSEDKTYLFSQNSMFNLFLNGDLVSFANIDDKNDVHIIDVSLRYDLYLVPKP